MNYMDRNAVETPADDTLTQLLFCRYLHYRQIKTAFHINMHTDAICTDHLRITVPTLQQAPSINRKRNYILHS
jgi:hypothetical protein